jgi:peptidoglycan/xylan/chitin deacetylase (PgdA/CDA1 family)
MAAHELIVSRIAIPGVPVFMYHGVCPGPTTDDRYTLPLPMFREHLSFLHSQKFRVENSPTPAGEASGRSAVLTFDDGLSSHYESVFPALLEHGLTAAFFVNTALTGSTGYLNWNQLREMSAAGMTIGSHGRDHIDYSKLEPAIAQRELQDSRQALEAALGVPVSGFAAPYGAMGNPLIKAARRAGFDRIYSSNPWLASGGATVVSRLAIYRDTDLHRFSAFATRSAFPLLARRARNVLLYLPKQLVLRTCPERLRGTGHEEAE